MTTSSNRRRIAVVLSLMLVLFSGASALFLLHGVNQQTDDFFRVYELRRDARELLLGLVEAETGQRGYLLTLDEQYLEPYQASLSGIDQSITSLLEESKPFPEQRQRILDVLSKIDDKRQELARSIQLVSSGQRDEAMALLGNDAGKLLMDEIRVAINGFISTEDEQFNERNSGVNTLRLALVIAIIAALAGAVVLAYFLFNRTRRELFELGETRRALLDENEELEERVRARTRELEEARAHADQERARVEAVLQDTNHRIGNSLATVSSLLGLQLMRTQSDEVKLALEAARARVHAIASGHRRLRLGNDMETTRADEFLQAVIEDIEATYSGTTPVAFGHHSEPLVILARDATTLGIILGELVTNALKHAFPDGRGGTITARLYSREDGVVCLEVSDDGVGIRHNGSEGLGSLIIKQLARQFSGEVIYAPGEAGGTCASVLLPGLEQRPGD